MSLLQRTKIPRPTLPDEHYNEKLMRVGTMALPVEYRFYLMDDEMIPFATMMVPSPNGGGATVFRRLDTGNISLSSMFRACYPDATDGQERAEMNWVRANYPTDPHSIDTWISPQLALHLAYNYDFDDILLPLTLVKPIIRQAGVPIIPRPSLPQSDGVMIKSSIASDSLAVVFNVGYRDGCEATVGIVKVTTSEGTTDIVRRFDTGDISLSSMFRASFPDASHHARQGEMEWVRGTFELTNHKNSGLLPFRGTWIPPALALQIARDYNISDIVLELANSDPRSRNPRPFFLPANRQEMFVICGLAMLILVALFAVFGALWSTSLSWPSL